jgi:2'-5' RNA ligase
VRLFVAVNLPEEERRAAWAAAAPLRAGDAPVTWVPEPNLHVTMTFLGEVDASQAGPIGSALTSAVQAVRPFDLTLGGGGAFPDAAHPRVFWIGVEKHPALELLANDVMRVVGAFGFEPELKPFHPHVTIGRAKKDAAIAALAPVAERLAGIDYTGMLQVESVDLMESRREPGGSHYRAVHRAMLGG